MLQSTINGLKQAVDLAYGGGGGGGTGGSLNDDAGYQQFMQLPDIQKLNQQLNDAIQTLPPNTVTVTPLSGLSEEEPAGIPLWGLLAAGVLLICLAREK